MKFYNIRNNHRFTPDQLVEYMDKSAQVHVQIFQTARADLGIEPLSQETLKLLGNSVKNLQIK